MDRVKALLTDKDFVGRTYTTNVGAAFKVISIDDFCYTDPVDHSVSENQVRSVLSSLRPTRWSLLSTFSLNQLPPLYKRSVRICECEKEDEIVELNEDSCHLVILFTKNWIVYFHRVGPIGTIGGYWPMINIAICKVSTSVLAADLGDYLCLQN